MNSQVQTWHGGHVFWFMQLSLLQGDECVLLPSLVNMGKDNERHDPG